MLRIFFILFFALDVSAQEFIPAPFFGMGNSGYSQHSIYTLSSNQSGISRMTSPQIALAYQQHFMGTDIQTQALLFATPIKSLGNFGLVVQNYGIPKTSSLIKLGISYSKFFGKSINTSVTINYHQYSVTSYLSANNWSADLGFQYLQEQFHIGAVFKNISKSTFSSDVSQPLSQEIGLGATYLLSNEVHVLVEAKKISDAKIIYSSGIQYAIHSRLKLRGGVSANPTQFYLGIGFLVKKLTIDVANKFHTQLGSSPQLAVAYEF